MKISAVFVAFLLGKSTADWTPHDASALKPREPGGNPFTIAPPRETGSISLGLKPRGHERVGLYSGSDGAASLQRRADQIPFVFCPESYGGQPKSCDKCGGDNLRHGVCKNLLLSGAQPPECFSLGQFCQGYHCKCVHEGRPHNKQITSTAVANGQTGTIVYEPMSLTDYAKLRHKTTVTITTSRTATTTGEGSIETELAVVFAAGWIWAVICKPDERTHECR